jgi:TM2 domain-containing membrane protein YozV
MWRRSHVWPRSRYRTPKRLPFRPALPQFRQASLRWGNDCSADIWGMVFMLAMTLPAPRRKSVGLAYVLWALFGLFGLHRFYLGRNLSAAGMAAITVLSVPLIWSGLGLLGFVTTGTWALADALLIPAMARELNETGANPA